MAFDPRRLGLVRRDRRPAAASFACGLVGTVGLEDPGLRLDDLAERPERDSLAVRKRTPLTPDDELGIVVDDAKSSRHEPRLLPIPGHADERDELRLALGPSACQRTDRTSSSRPGRRAATAASEDRCRSSSARSSATQTRDGLGLPLCVDRLGSLVLDRTLGRAIRVLADQDPAGRRRRLEAGARVDHVARDHRLARPRHARRGATSASPVFTPIRTSSSSVGIRLVQLGDRLLDRERRADGPLRVVLVRDGCAEDADDGVADELLDRSAVTLELVPRARRGTGRRMRPHVLGIELLRASGRPDEVREDDGDDLALLAPRDRRGASAVPHSEQNFALSAFSEPQDGHAAIARVYAGGPSRSTA